MKWSQVLKFRVSRMFSLHCFLTAVHFEILLQLMQREKTLHITWASHFTELLNETSQWSCAAAKTLGFVGSGCAKPHLDSSF